MQIMKLAKRKYNQQPNIITRSTDQMTLIEKRLMYLVINQMEMGFNVQEDLFRNIEFKIPSKELGEPNYTRIREALTKLQGRRITLIDDFKKQKFHSIVPFPYVSIEKGWITLKMLGDVAPYFLELKNGFTKYELKAALSLNSVYSQKLYELLSRWKDKKEWEVEIEELKLLLDATDYRYTDFRRVCIEPALLEITEKTDLNVSYLAIKVGRKVGAIKFTILTEKEKAKKDYEEEIADVKGMAPAEIAHYTRNLIRNYSFSNDQIDKIMADQRLFSKFIDIESKIAHGVIKNVKNPTAYMAKSLFEY